MIDYLQALKNDCNKFLPFVAPVLNDPRFSTWSGAGKPIHHHYGDGGLLKHTYEVFEFCKLIAMQHNSTCMSDNRINPKELLISAIWHDYGKIWDYQKDENGVWGKHDNHARRIHHISRSAIEWGIHCKYLNTILIYDDLGVNMDNVTHNILAHHGMREWGSPVAPAIKEAWILHLCDNMSARLDDCNKHDRIQ